MTSFVPRAVPAEMKTEVRLPQWGMGMTVTTTFQCLTNEGEAVAEDEEIPEDKAEKVTNISCRGRASVGGPVRTTVAEWGGL